MARSRLVDPSAPHARDRQSTRKNDGAAMAGDQSREDPRAMAHGVVTEESSATSSQAAKATINKGDPEEAVAVPTPIGCWKVTSPDGREERVFKPIPGFEHLCNGPAPSQGLPCLASSAEAQVRATSKDDQMKKRKRTRSCTRGRPQQTIVQQLIDEDDDDLYDDGDFSVPTMKSRTFYIGDVDELKRFFRRRLDEFTMKPVRPIVTAWVKLLEPKRLTRFGPYHKKLPREQPPECTPPWWPQDVPYEEPSHLDKAGLLTLAVDLMLQHRSIDVVKRTMDWVGKLEKAARYAVETTPPDQFSSSKGSAFSERMQKRALSEILPNLFDIAKSYEAHLATYNLYEGTNARDPGTGTRVTWQPLTRPPRQPSAPRKRFRRTKTTAPPRVESDADRSRNEIDVANTITESRLRQEEAAREPRASLQQAQARSHGHAASQQYNMDSRSSATTPNTSFGQSMHTLQPCDNMDLDVKVNNPAPYHDQTLGQSNFHCSQPMQCCTNHSRYRHVLHHQQGVGSSGIVPVSASGYDQPFSMFPPPYHPQAEGAAFGSSAGFPYDYDTFAPSFFDGLPNLGSTSCQPESSCD